MIVLGASQKAVSETNNSLTMGESFCQKHKKHGICEFSNLRINRENWITRIDENEHEATSSKSKSAPACFLCMLKRQKPSCAFLASNECVGLKFCHFEDCHDGLS